MRSAEKAFQLARRKAQYTRLTAPVEGAIAEKVISENEAVQADLPSGVVGPQVNTDFGDVYPVMLSITGDGYSYAELKTVADAVRDDLLHLFDVAKVEIYGAQEERIFVEYNNARLAEVGLSPQQLKGILEARNIIQSGGSITSEGEEIVLEPSGNF
ncbi:MAG: efflux RND transporter permease subunit, partial [Desulfosarcinaceae bacterium]